MTSNKNWAEIFYTSTAGHTFKAGMTIKAPFLKKTLTNYWSFIKYNAVKALYRLPELTFYSFVKCNNLFLFFFSVENKALTFKEADICSAHQMREGVYYYLCYTVLFQFLPVGRPVVQSHDGRYASLPKPKQGSLIRDDKL